MYIVNLKCTEYFVNSEHAEKRKISPSLTKHHAMKTFDGMQVQLHVHLK
jgi:hypothetical protein